MHREINKTLNAGLSQMLFASIWHTLLCNYLNKAMNELPNEALLHKLAYFTDLVQVSTDSGLMSQESLTYPIGLKCQTFRILHTRHFSNKC